MPEFLIENWLATNTVSGGVEIRPHPRLLRRFAIFSTIVNTILATIAMVAVLSAWSFACFFLAVLLVDAIGLSTMHWAIPPIILGAFAAVGFVVFAGKKTYRRAVVDQSPPLRISIDGGVNRKGVDYIVGPLAVGVRAHRVTVKDDEGTLVSYRVSLVKPSGDLSLPLPMPDRSLGYWDEKQNKAEAALAFADFVGRALNVPVEDATKSVEAT